jgi:transcriptional regulator with XRE-family HTH domain
MESGPRPLGAQIGALRRSCGLSQLEVARRIGRPQSIVSRWERGDRDPTPADVVALCAVLGVDPAELLAVSAPSVSARRRGSRSLTPRLRVAFGVRLRLAREEQRLDPLEVHQRTGITPYELRRAEEARGGLSMGALQRLMALYGVSLADLLSPAEE